MLRYTYLTSRFGHDSAAFFHHHTRRLKSYDPQLRSHSIQLIAKRLCKCSMAKFADMLHVQFSVKIVKRHAKNTPVVKPGRLH